MIRIFLFDTKMQAIEEGGEELLERWKSDTNSRIWIDFFDENPEEESYIMEDVFNIHPLAIIDAQRIRHPAKIENFSDHTFLLLKGLSAKTNSIDFATIQIAIIISDRFLITRHAEESVSIDKLWSEVKWGQNLSDKPQLGELDNLVIQLTNFIARRYLPILMEVEDRLEEIEIQITENPNDTLLAELIDYKSNFKKLSRIIAYHTGVFNELKKNKWPGFHADQKHEINDIYEQLERANSLTSLYNEIASDLQDGYISVASHKLNNIVKVLTIITVLFIPLGFLAGVYGMNFEYIPELSFKYGYFILLSVMGSIAAGLLVLFKRIKWL